MRAIISFRDNIALLETILAFHHSNLLYHRLVYFWSVNMWREKINFVLMDTIKTVDYIIYNQFLI